MPGLARSRLGEWSLHAPVQLVQPTCCRESRGPCMMLSTAEPWFLNPQSVSTCLRALTCSKGCVWTSEGHARWRRARFVGPHETRLRCDSPTTRATLQQLWRCARAAHSCLAALRRSRALRPGPRLGAGSEVWGLRPVAALSMRNDLCKKCLCSANINVFPLHLTVQQSEELRQI